MIDARPTRFNLIHRAARFDRPRRSPRALPSPENFSDYGHCIAICFLTNTVLPTVSKESLKRLMDGKKIDRLQLSVNDGEFACAF